MSIPSAIKTSIAIAATVAVLSLGTAVATSVPAFAHSSAHGQNQMGHMMNKHQMGHMMNKHHMGGHFGAALDLDVDDVRKIIEGRLVMHGGDRLKVGKIVAVDDEKITAEIVTVDDSLVIKLEFDRKSGAHHPVR